MQLRLMLWLLVAVALAGVAALLLGERTGGPSETSAPGRPNFGGSFTLVGSDGEPFSSAKLKGKPYVIYFGFTRCGDVCPTTLSRMVKLRKQIGGPDKFNIVFVRRSILSTTVRRRSGNMPACSTHRSSA